MEEEIDKIKEFEDLFGNTPFENIKKIQKYIKANYIPKSVIEEEIKKLDELIKEAQVELGSASKEFTIYVYQKDILQELLEKGNK